MSRESFLARVRQAAAAGRAYRVTIAETPPGTGYAGAASEDLCQAFGAEAAAVGGQVSIVEGIEAARQELGSLLDRESPKSAFCWRHPLLDRLELGELLRQRSIQAIDVDAISSLPEEQQRQQALAAECGITSCDFAVAETGSLTMCSRPGQERMASLLPPWHVAIVAESQIVPDLFDVFERIGRAGESPPELPSNVTFITGPSKTGDIELELTTGVHGPGVWRLIVVRGC